MISTLVGLLVGAVVAFGTWAAVAPTFDVAPLRRTNYRGAPLVTGTGVLVPVALIVVVAVAQLALAAGVALGAATTLLYPALLAATGFSLLGLLDDVAGVGQSGGFRGHLAELGRGRVSSGMLKLLGGAAMGVAVAGTVGAPSTSAAWSTVGLLRDGAIVALAANFANLLDRAPGRVIKVTTALLVVAAAVARTPVLVGPAVGVGAGLGMAPADLRERAMLGDAGANPLGALCAMAGLVAVPGTPGRWVLLVALLGLNLLSEAVSFSAVIDRVGPLRWLDRLGATPERRAVTRPRSDGAE